MANMCFSVALHTRISPFFDYCYYYSIFESYSCASSFFPFHVLTGNFEDFGSLEFHIYIYYTYIYSILYKSNDEISFTFQTTLAARVNT